ncbi:MAG: glycosyltransferase family 4 protein [Bacilli bacterium]|jgi:UDP-GlcNAc:undecaprenyl-phosphate GlcNAc-1-phosphate transferase
MNYNLMAVLFMVLVTFIFTVLMVPLVKRIAFHVGAIDYPNKRKIHKEPMPSLGGLAIFMGFLLGYMLFARQTVEMNSILIGSFIIILTGILDDIKPLQARYKFFFQIIAAIVITFYGGILLDNINAFGYSLNFGLFSSFITILFIVGMINSINLIDGLDGLAAGVSSIFFLTIGIIAFMLNKLNGLDIMLSFIMLGSTLGFLVHNFHPAKIFMGDTGSMFLGFIISVIALIGLKKVTLTSFLIPLLIMAVPILDTLFAIIRRVINKKGISTSDKQHLHHQLLEMNFSCRATVLIIYYINALFAIATIIYFLKDRQIGTYIYITLLIIVFWFVLTTNIIKNQQKRK